MIKCGSIHTRQLSDVDYGSSFSDIIQGLEHALESLVSGQVQDPSSFKYRDALEKQVSLMLIFKLNGLSSLAFTDSIG